VIGRYILQPEVMRVLEAQEKGAGGEIQLTDAMARMIGKQPFHGLTFDGVRYDCGDKAGFIQANIALALERPDIVVEPMADEAAVARLKARGLLVNVVDRLDLCDFTLPAIVDRDPVLVAIGTGGASAGLAAALRQRLETVLPASLGRVAARFTPHATASRRASRCSMIAAARSADLLAPGGGLDPTCRT
jgi:hypothetical protein